MTLTSKTNDIKKEQPRRFPSWLKKQIPQNGMQNCVREKLRVNLLHTVCEEARCPNRAECFAKGTATFLIMGNSCTRNCRFCAIDHNASPGPADKDEHKKVAHAAKSLGLSYVVITSVTRDDLPDGGAHFFAQSVQTLKCGIPDIRVEVLIPDFMGKRASLETVMDSGIDVLNHNLETVPRLYEQVRPQADYKRSLKILENAGAWKNVITKSGIMVGLGEKTEEVVETMKDMADAGCSILTIGQYLQPTPAQLEVREFVPPSKFRYYKEEGEKAGIKEVVAGPFVRSSYEASTVFENIYK